MSWLCKNCGHVHQATDALKELGFKWLLEGKASSTRCMQCKSYTIQRPYSFDADGLPMAGEFLVVTSHIRKGKL